MPARKKYTELVFDQIYRGDDVEDYGYLGLICEIMKKLSTIREDFD